MEPSLGWWARTADHAKARVEAGFRNFLFSIEDFILHFCVRRYLCESEQRYHITDISKGAMLVHRAGLARSQRYDRWYGLLLEELELCATANAGIIAVGKAVSRHLAKRGFQRPFARVIHCSGQAAPARSAGIIGFEDRFEVFRSSVCLEDVIATSEAVLNEARLPSEIRNETLSRLAKESTVYFSSAAYVQLQDGV